MKGLAGFKGCFNCFSEQHRAGACRMKTCKFCNVPNEKAQHYSIMCKKAPKSLVQFMSEKEKERLRREGQRQGTGVRVAQTGGTYTFSDRELFE